MTMHLRVNPITCAAHGLCAELFPEGVSLDEWGYPLIKDAPVSRSEMAHAKRAVAQCPTLALQLVRT
jgi:ferredoxin